MFDEFAVPSGYVRRKIVWKIHPAVPRAVEHGAAWAREMRIRKSAKSDRDLSRVPFGLPPQRRAATRAEVKFEFPPGVAYPLIHCVRAGNLHGLRCKECRSAKRRAGAALTIPAMTDDNRFRLAVGFCRERPTSASRDPAQG